MNFPRRYRFRCPSCKTVFAKSFSRVRLGPGLFECKYCHHRFPDGSVEWPRASKGVRIEYLVPSKLLINSFVGTIAGLILILNLWPIKRDFIAVALFGAALAFAPLLMRLTVCAGEISKSKARYDKCFLDKMGYVGGTAGQG
jgi:hypothetical protein